MEDTRSNELLAYLARRGDLAARDTLCLRLRSWVHGIAFKMQHPMMPLEDLIQEGMLGVLDALQRFDFSRRLKFTTFAQARVHGSMVDAYRSKVEISRTPRNRQGHNRQVKQWPELTKDNGDREQILEPLADEVPPPAIEGLKPWLKGMSKTERLLMIGYYVEGQTMKAIGDQLDLSESRVSQLHSVLLQRLRTQEYSDHDAPRPEESPVPHQRLQGPPRPDARHVQEALVHRHEDAA